MGNRKKLKKHDPVPFEDRPGFKTVPLTFMGETCGIAEIDLSTGEAAATVITGSNFDRWLGHNEEGDERDDFCFSIGMVGANPISADVVLTPAEDGSNDIEGEVLENN